MSDDWRLSSTKTVIPSIGTFTPLRWWQEYLFLFFFFVFSCFFPFFLLVFFSCLSSTDIFFSLKSGSVVSSRDSLSRHWTSINETFAEGQHQIIRHIMQKDVKRVLLPYSVVRSCLKLSHQMWFQFFYFYSRSQENKPW